MTTLTRRQREALEELGARGRLWPHVPRHDPQRAGPRYSVRTLDALVQAGHARWEHPMGQMRSIVPASPALALTIALEALATSGRDDVSYWVELAEAGKCVVLFDGTTSLHIADGTDQGTGEQYRYGWITWAVGEAAGRPPEYVDYWDVGGSDSETEARAHVAAWLDREAS